MMQPSRESAGQQVWRLLKTPPMGGAWNMAVDEALLICLQWGVSPPTLRLYRWEQPCVSLGYAQDFGDINAEACAKVGIDIVRRPSGGGAVLHDEEVTYCIVVPTAQVPDGGSVPASYVWLCQGLTAGLRRLGILAEQGRLQGCKAARLQGESSFCFGRLTDADLHVGGRKIVGGAQVRRRGVILQHGSVPLRLNGEKLREVFGQDASFEKVTWLEREAGRALDFEEVGTALAAGFQKALGMDFEPNELFDFERCVARELHRQKYSRAGWTQERRTAPGLPEALERLRESLAAGVLT